MRPANGPDRVGRFGLLGKPCTTQKALHSWSASLTMPRSGANTWRLQSLADYEDLSCCVHYSKYSKDCQRPKSYLLLLPSHGCRMTPKPKLVHSVDLYGSIIWYARSLLLCTAPENRTPFHCRAPFSVIQHCFSHLGRFSYMRDRMYLRQNPLIGSDNGF